MEAFGNSLVNDEVLSVTNGLILSAFRISSTDAFLALRLVVEGREISAEGDGNKRDPGVDGAVPGRCPTDGNENAIVSTG